MSKRLMLALTGLLAHACSSAGQGEGSALEPGELFPGGDATGTLSMASRSFNHPAPTLSRDEQDAFAIGDGFFTPSWVAAPASGIEDRDGVGPTFNARGCSGCHFKAGRGAPKDDDPTAVGLVLRLSIPGEGAHGEPLGDPSYGDQLQDRSLPDIPVEGRFRIELEAVPGEHEDGESYELRAPSYHFEELSFGALADELRVSPRLAPQLIGMGLLEAIPEQRLEALADPEDADGEGVSGRVQRVWDVAAGELRVGRFGWKAEQPSVAQQTAAAFLGDLGVTTRLFSEQNCPEPQRACAGAIDGGDPEAQDDVFDDVVLHTRAIAVPARRSADDPEVLRGRALFREAGCDACHAPTHRTGPSPIAALSEQTIWPYTDLLLHDMGEALSDERPVFAAEGREWRTPPLWGIGLLERVNGHERLMHDGRARGVAEAILWHGGEAEPARESFRAMTRADRDALVRFVRSL